MVHSGECLYCFRLSCVGAKHSRGEGGGRASCPVHFKHWLSAMDTVKCRLQWMPPVSFWLLSFVHFLNVYIIIDLIIVVWHMQTMHATSAPEVRSKRRYINLHIHSFIHWMQTVCHLSNVDHIFMTASSFVSQSLQKNGAYLDSQTSFMPVK